MAIGNWQTYLSMTAKLYIKSAVSGEFKSLDSEGDKTRLVKSNNLNKSQQNNQAVKTAQKNATTLYFVRLNI